MPTSLRLLIAEDSEDDALLLVRTLRQADYTVAFTRVETPAALTDALARTPWDVVISDFNMPAFNGVEALKIVRAHDRELPFIFVSGSIGEDTAVNAMRAGAQDYVMKGNLSRLAPAIARELLDVEVRRQHEGRLRALQAQFLQAQKMEAVGQLAGGIAHDFNNLLTVITSYSDFLLDDLAPDSAHREEVRQIRTAAEAATALSRQLLVFSRSQVLQPQVVSANEVISASAKLLKRLIGADVELVLRLDPDAGLIEVDPGQLEQVVMNLAINARDAMPTGGKLVVETKNSVLEQGDEPGTPHVTIAVSDTGTGITQATLAHIFEPFFTTKEVGKGTGLGLSTVYTIIQQFDGYIHVFSEPGLGTTFSIQLPRITAPRESVVPIAQGPLDALRGNEVVLLVEDAAAVRSVARQVLERFGYTVLEAPDGATALHLASKLHGPVDVLVTDLVMPGMSGQDLAAGFRALRPKAKVLYTSGYNEKGTHHHRELDPSLPFLQKPFTPETLARKVRETLDAP